MFVDTQIGTKAPRQRYTKGIEYMLVTALAAVTVVLFFVMGFFSQATAATSLPTLVSPQTATLADTHILMGLALLAVSLMAGSTFGLWRWQIRGFVLEARHRAR